MPNKERIILHCDLNNFYASVECLKNPSLTGAVAVCGDPSKRHGVILAKNEEAKKFSIKTGDTVIEAMRKCPTLTLVKTSFDDYAKYSKMVFKIYERFTDRVEPFGADECWLDCTGSTSLFGDGEQIANTIRETVKKEIGLTVSVGVSFNKVFAKLGSDLKKPDATTVISKDNFKKLIWGLPASDMLAVGRKTGAKLSKLGINTIGDLAEADENLLKAIFGINGEKMKLCAQGKDTEEVRFSYIPHKNKSYGHGMTTVKDVTSLADAETVITYLTERVALRMSGDNVRGNGVALNIRFSDLTHASKQCRASASIFSAAEITAYAMKLLNEMWDLTPLRSITVSVFDLTENEQLSMFEGDYHQKSEKLELALERIRAKHGKDKISLANLMGTDFIYDKNDAEDFLPFQR